MRRPTRRGGVSHKDVVNYAKSFLKDNSTYNEWKSFINKLYTAIDYTDKELKEIWDSVSVNECAMIPHNKINRLNESQLDKIVKKTVRKVLNESEDFYFDGENFKDCINEMVKMNGAESTLNDLIESIEEFCDVDEQESILNQMSRWL